MPDVTVSQFANVIGVSVERLQEQLQESGLSSKTAEELITDEEKDNLLNYLRSKHGKDPVESKKITLKRKKTSELKIPPVGAQSRNKVKQSSNQKIVNVEFRKKHTYVKRSFLEDAQATPESEVVELPVERKDRADGVLDEPEKISAPANSPDDSMASSDSPEISSADGEQGAQVVAQTDDVKDVEEPVAPVTDPVPVSDPTPEDKVKKVAPKSTKVKAGQGKSSDKGGGKNKDKNKDKEKDKEKDKGKDKATRYGRRELHVATAKSGRRKKKHRRRKVIPMVDPLHSFEKPTEPVIREVDIPENISVSDLARRMSIKATEVMKLMMELGSMATINQMLDQETAVLVVEEMGHKAKRINESELEELLVRAAENSGNQVKRAPVVTVMGHVDHGKTSLLDYIRSSQVADGEAGKITQHIGAYAVESSKGKIVFLDTPGHAAFIAMRARGASITDLIVLVVAADDGVMPQTRESVEHAKNANVPIIVAVNKIDKAEADPERVKQELSNLGIISEEWGGDTQFVHISAKTGAGIDSLLEVISLQDELLELKASESGTAVGIVIEARLDQGRGPIATILVRSGVLNKGDIVLSGKEFGHVRAIIDSSGNELLTPVGPSTPVEILGLSGIPDAGDEMIVVADEKKAREIAALRRSKGRESKLARQHATKLQNAMNEMSNEPTAAICTILVKADTRGSVEAIVDALDRLSTDEVSVRIVSSGVGGITESDINLAITSEAMVVGFNVRAGSSARKLAKEEGMEIYYYSIIYNLLDDVKGSMSGMLKPELHEHIFGTAEVIDVFKSPKFGDIAGCIVSTGVMKKSNPIRVLRDDVVIYEGQLESLRRFKDDVNEVKSGIECGIGVKNYNNVKPGDQIEVFEEIEVKRKI